MTLAVKVAIRTEPARAVPSEAPRFVEVFCKPPTSPLTSSGTEETVTAPSWDADTFQKRPADDQYQQTRREPVVSDPNP